MSLINGPLWTLVHLCLKFPAIAVGTCAISVVGLLALQEDTRPMVAITFDDGYRSVHELALPEMQRREFVGTHYITTGLIDTEGYLPSDLVSDFVDAGWEIGAHTVTHPYLTELTDAEIMNELILPVTTLPQISAEQEIFSFSSPYGDFDERTLAHIEATYYNHVNAWSEQRGVNTVEDFDIFNVHRLDFGWSDVEEICATVSNLPDESLFAIIFHDITNEEGQYNTTFEEFTQVLDCIEDANVNVVRISDAAQVMENRREALSTRPE